MTKGGTAVSPRKPPQTSLPQPGSPAHFVLTRGLLLAVLLLGATLALLLKAAQGGPLAPRLYDYAGVLQDAALLAFSGGVLGGRLLQELTAEIS